MLKIEDSAPIGAVFVLWWEKQGFDSFVDWMDANMGKEFLNQTLDHYEGLMDIVDMLAQYPRPPKEPDDSFRWN